MRHRIFPSILLIVAAGSAVGLSITLAQNTPSANSPPVVPAGLTNYPFGSPTGDAVEMLEVINRARSNPTAEGQRLVAALNAAYPGGGSGSDLTQLAAQFASFPVRPPMVFNADLEAAATAHLTDNIRLGTDSHDSPDGTTPGVRVQQFGYSPLFSENCNGTAGYTTVLSPFTTNGTYELNDAGHRDAILETSGLGEVEVGIGFNPTGGWNVEDFGGNNTVTLLGGVVFNDNAGSGSFVSGEGVNDVLVTSNASSYYAITVNGGYVLPLDLAPLYDASKASPVVMVAFMTTAGDVITKSVTLGHTVAANGQTYSNVAGQTRYDNAKADWVRPASETPTPTPAPSPTPTPTPVPRVPEVTITPSPDGTARFTIFRDGDTSQALTVIYQIKGSAIAGTDYLPLTGKKTMKPGKSSVKIRVSVVPEGKGTLKLRLVGTDAYGVGSPNQAKVRLLGNP